MELNSFLFPAPTSSYSIHGAIGDLIYIPREFQHIKPKNKPKEELELDEPVRK